MQFFSEPFPETEIFPFAALLSATLLLLIQIMKNISLVKKRNVCSIEKFQHKYFSDLRASPSD